MFSYYLWNNDEKVGICFLEEKKLTNQPNKKKHPILMGFVHFKKNLTS